MVVDRLQRRMAAILAADVVGYSRLIGMDEEATLATLNNYRSVIDGLISHHAGRVFGSAGDSVIAEFGSPVEAVRCATEIQLEIGRRNTERPEPSRMRFRIGINLGDLVVDGDNLMGDGVNVAARLEALAPPGGICISEAIHAQVRDRLSLDFLDLGEHKVKNIARPVRAYRVPLASEEQVKSPFRGLDVFDFDHADIFFGRARAVAKCKERLEQQAANGKAFLLIYGMSGSGKSSLLRAGLLPALTRPGVVAGITCWRHCLFRPSEGSDAIASLAAGLFREAALPELAQERTSAELAELLRSTPDRALALIRAALGKAATTAGSGPSQARLALAVDQMEELFTTETDPASREALVRILAMLAASGSVWVIGTIRADFFHRCGEVPGFSTLKDGLGSYELLPPTGPEIAQIIREPARVAGLRFEEDAEQGRLEDVLQEAASADPESLPLLEFVLDALYQAGRDRRLLTFAAYRALGGLEGAIARRADEVVDALPPHIQEALPAVLRALTTVRLGDEAITAGPASLDEVAGTPAQVLLVDALIAARLLVSDEDVAGRSVIRVAHEALLSRWPRARDIVNANRAFLETRTRIQSDARRWLLEGKNQELLLPSGKRLAEAEELLLARRNEVDDRIVEYIDASLSADAKRRNLETAAAMRVARRTRIAAVVALVLAIGAGAGAVLGFRGQQEAVRQTQRAEENARQAHVAEKSAIEARNEALRNQSLSLSFLAQQTAQTGDTEAAILLSLEALPKDAVTPDRPLQFEAGAALYDVLLKHQQLMIFRHDGGLTSAAFNPDGSRIVTSSVDNTARIWSVANGAELALLSGHQATVDHATFSPSGGRILTAGRDGTARVWNASGEQVFVLQQAGDVRTAIFSPDGEQILTTSDASNPTLWDAQTGKEITRMPSPAFAAAFSPDGRSFATSDPTLRTLSRWNAHDGKLIKNFFLETGLDNFQFSPDGSRMMVSPAGSFSFGEKPTLVDVSNGTAIAELASHRSDIYGFSFSHDGNLVATASVDGTARLWDVISGKPIGRLGSEAVGLRADDIDINTPDQVGRCAFSPDDRFLATAAMDNTVRIWDVQIRSLFAVIRGHSSSITRLEFSPDGGTLLTASQDGTARLWDIDGVLTTSLYHMNRPSIVVFSPDGSRVLTGGNSSILHLWETASGREITQLVAKDSPIIRVSFSPDGRSIATASFDGRILLWEAASGRQLGEVQDKLPDVLDLEFSDDGQLLFFSSAEGHAYIWDLDTGVLITAISTSGALRKSALSPDAKLVLAVLEDGRLQLWDLDGDKLPVPGALESGVSAASFSPDGRLLATGSIDGRVRLWPIGDGEVGATLEGHSEPVTEIAFSRDGQSLVTTSRDGVIHVSKVENAETQAILREPTGAVTEAEFSPNGAYLLTVSRDSGAVRIWSVSSGREIASLAEQPTGKTETAFTHAEFNSGGTRIATVTGDRVVRIIRLFPTPSELIQYSRSIVPRELTPCERRHFFLPAEGDVGDCAS